MAPKKASQTKAKTLKTSKAPRKTAGKTKPKAKATKSHQKSNVVSMKAKKAPMANKNKKAVKNQPTPSGHTHLFWKLLEAKKQGHKEHAEKHHQADHDHQRHIDDRQATKVARFMGPRRRAA